MPYPADLVGKVVDINFETDLRPSELKGIKPLHGLSAQMDVPVFDYHPPRAGVGGAPPIPQRFADTGAPWNIEFLWWYPGENTTCRLQRPVLTGPMSGCYLFRYVSGGPRIVHIGTCEVAQESLRTKQNWKIYVNHTLGQAGSLTVFGNTPPRQRHSRRHGALSARHHAGGENLRIIPSGWQCLHPRHAATLAAQD